MISLACYSLLDTSTITEGIAVDDFESIIVNAPETLSIKKATIQTLPILTELDISAPEIGKLSQVSLSFISLASENIDISDAGVILCIDPAIWRLCSDSTNAVILDPCGLTGNMLLFVHKNRANVLVAIDDPSLTVSVNDANEVVIRRMNRANMMLAALVEDVIQADLPGSQTTYLPAPYSRVLTNSLHNAPQDKPKAARRKK